MDVAGPVWYPHVAARLPVLIQQSSIDAAFTGVHAIDATQPAALAAWRQQAEDSLVGVGWLFSGDTSYHVLADLAFGRCCGDQPRAPPATARGSC